MRTQAQRPAVHEDAARAAVHAEQRIHDIGPARAHQPEEPHDLSRMDLEVNAFEAPGQAQAAHLEQGVVCGQLPSAWQALPSRAAAMHLVSGKEGL